MTKLFLLVLLIAGLAVGQTNKMSEKEYDAYIQAYFDESRVELALADLTIKQAKDTLRQKLKQ